MRSWTYLLRQVDIQKINQLYHCFSPKSDAVSTVPIYFFCGNARENNTERRAILSLQERQINIIIFQAETCVI